MEGTAYNNKKKTEIRLTAGAASPRHTLLLTYRSFILSSVLSPIYFEYFIIKKHGIQAPLLILPFALKRSFRRTGISRLPLSNTCSLFALLLFLHYAFYLYKLTRFSNLYKRSAQGYNYYNNKFYLITGITKALLL